MTASIHRLDSEGLPPPGIEYRLANEILGKSNRLSRNILTELMGRPRRYSDLKGLLHGKSENNLTHALKQLLEEGVVRQRVDARQAKPIFYYQLSFLGIQVILKMEQLKFARLVSQFTPLLQSSNFIDKLEKTEGKGKHHPRRAAHGA